MRKVDLLFFDAGGGHRSAATALKAVAEQSGKPWDVRLVNLQEVLDSLDIFRKLTGIRMQDVYNRMLAAGWTLGSEYLVPVMQAIIRLYHPAQVRMMAEFWRRDTPDVVVSVVPNFNRALFQAIRKVSDTVPYVTILTDFADFPPHFWMEKQDQHVICGTDHAFAQAKNIGYDPARIHGVSGMILRPIFYSKPEVNRAEERRKLGLDPSLPTGLVLFGGQGSPKMLSIARRLQSAATAGLQLILVCGRNQRLARDLAQIQGEVPMHIVGFTDQIPYYMALSDFFIGKPGPGSISEAVEMGLPVIIERNAWTLPQERYNATWVEEKGVGVVVKDFDDIAGAVSRLVAEPAFSQYCRNAAAIRNRAVFEIIDILDRILA